MAGVSLETRASKHRYSLEDLNIGVSLDPFGDEQITIKLNVDPVFGVAELRAVFDNDTRQWKLITSTHTSLADGQRAKWKPRRAKRPLSDIPAALWTQNLPLSEHVDFFLTSVDWDATPLGPLSSWPIPLQTCCHLIFADSRPAILYWGPEKIAIYNSFYKDQVSGGLKKPMEYFMGKPFKEIWPELWQDFEPMFEDIIVSGEAIDTIDLNLFPTFPDGFVEETFWSGSFLPIRGEHGSTVGFYNRGIDSTKQVIQDRRSAMLNAIAAPPDLEGSSVWAHIFNALRSDERDFPMAYAYAADDDPSNSSCSLELRQSLGLPSQGHPLVPKQCDIYNGTTGFIPFYRKAKATNQAVFLHRSDGSLPNELLEGFTWRGFGEKSHSLAILPIAASNRLLGILVFGLNSRRRFDGDYNSFVNILARQASATIASALDREETHRRAARLTTQLAESEKQIRDLAEYGPVGILRVAPNGRIMWANPQFYEITGHSRAEDENYELSFVSIVDEQDQPTSAGLWPVLIEEHKSVSAALRLKKKWQPPQSVDASQPEEQPAWILANAYPVIEDGQVTSVAASVVEISAFKWAEAVQSRMAKDAEAAKRLQETFIDVVSHEMRNPLSAITQLADGIAASLEDFDKTSSDIKLAYDLLLDNVESGKTILLCANHQKRIIDDVLTLSKLDSMMLSITPVVVQPHSVVNSVLKIFEAEFDTHSIEVESSFDRSYHQNAIDWVCLDPARLAQIFINLITNAIKFTKFESVRQIKITTSATLERPPLFAGVTWFPTNKVKLDLTSGSEWGHGQPVYLLFAISDTGKGLEKNEMDRLFVRFQQATAKTHIKYGGSGLGLFISRQLTEMQGGEIGVFSAPGNGSTFAFYIKARRAAQPDEPGKVLAPPDSRKSAERHCVTSQKPKVSDGILSSPKPCVLLVEDNLVNAQVLSKQLKKAGFEVYLANHGEECLDLLAQSRSWKDRENENAVDFDCILMDVEMPVMDGLTASRTIRKLEQEGKLVKHIRIIAITANARDEQIREALNAGVDSVQPKPFRVQELLQNIWGAQLEPKS